MPGRYGLIDLLTLAERVFAPLLDVVWFERVKDVGGMPTHTAPDSHPPGEQAGNTIESMPEGDQRIPAGSAGPCVTKLMMQPTCTDTVTRIRSEDTLDCPIIETLAITDHPPAGQLFVRREKGKAVRYVEAKAEDSGELYRKRVKNGRTRYERAT